MDSFNFTQSTTVDQAVQVAARSATAQQGAQVRFVAGGTTLIDLMKLNVERPREIVDINGLPLDHIERSPTGGLVIGALARNSDVANHPIVLREYPVLSQALLSGAVSTNVIRPRVYQ
jgi:xanthine dehydrogenase YagS FAD-binding subunit